MDELLALEQVDIDAVAEKMDLKVGAKALLRSVIVRAQKRANPVSVCEWRVGT